MEKDHNQIWDNCLQVIKDNVPAISFRTWFEPIVPIKINNNILTIQVPSPFFYEYIEEQFIDLLSKSLRNELGDKAKLEYSVVMQNNAYSNTNPYTVKLPTNNKKELSNKPLSLPIDSRKELTNPFIIPGIQKLNIDPQLNPIHNFTNFIEGDCNRLARSAGFAVAKNPGKTAFNPLFIYGGSGLGKTHLAQSIGIQVKEDYSDKVVLYVTGHNFHTQYVESTLNNNRNDFVHFYQMIDVLIIDDIHEFAGKPKTQEIFFQIFNHLHQNNKQLILTSDKAPIDLQGMESRLLSRFKWGLSADLQIPNYETRIAILKQKIYNDGIELPLDIIEYIASQITTNIRELEGALISVLAQSTLNKKEITLDLAKKMIDRLVKNTKREISIDYIQKIVSDYFHMPIDLMLSKTRKRDIVQARQITMYFAREFTSESLASIGAQIGGKDHATVMHAHSTVNDLIETDKRFKNYINDIEKKINI